MQMTRQQRSNIPGVAEGRIMDVELDTPARFVAVRCVLVEEVFPLSAGAAFEG
jgi:hypothetical protein